MLFERADYWQSLAEQALPGNPIIRMARAYWFRLEGDFNSASRVMSEIETALGPRFASMPPILQGVAALMWVFEGNIEDGVKRLEALFPSDDKIPAGLLDVFQYLAYVYKQQGDGDLAARAVDRVRSSIDRARQFGGGRDPDTLALMARNHAIAGERAEAMKAFQAAVDEGYRRYFVTLHDPLWEGVRDDPEFQRLLETMRGDVGAMGRRVEQTHAGTRGLSTVEASLGTGPRSLSGSGRQCDSFLPALFPERVTESLKTAVPGNRAVGAAFRHPWIC